MSDPDREITILENIYAQPESVKQRDLAHIAGISLGMTNSILKRLIGKGLLIAQKINHRNIHYAVTPAGINEIMKRSYRYFKRTIKNIVVYKEKIDKLVGEIKEKGYDKIILIGKSDLDFIIEHSCLVYGMMYQYAQLQTSTETNNDSKVFYFYSENAPIKLMTPTERSLSLFDKLKDL
jgi:predicted transcriptional regulator